MLFFENLSRFETIKHSITTKEPNRAYQNSLALHTGEDIQKIYQNRQELAKYFGKSAKFVSVLQVHSSSVYKVDSYNEHGWSNLDSSIKADALITNLSNIVLTVLTADCVPLLVYEPNKGVVASIHAGWRGVVGGIVANTINTMVYEYGCNTKDMTVGIGPAIKGCCYEVGIDVADRFYGFPNALKSIDDNHYKLDLHSVVNTQLINLGVKDIEISSYCTSCNSDILFSYRKENSCSGRFMSCIMIKG